MRPWLLLAALGGPRAGSQRPAHHPGGFPDDLSRRQAEQLGPAYVALHAEPLRFVFRRYTLSALEFQWGTTLNQPGATLRLQLGLVHLGVLL